MVDSAQSKPLVPEDDPRTTSVPSGLRSSEFWLSLAAVLIGAVVSSGLLPDDSPWSKLLGVVLTVLAALGYTAGRSLVKREAIRGAAQIATAEVSAPLVIEQQSAARYPAGGPTVAP